MNNGRVEFSQLRTGTVRGYSFNLVDVGIGTPISSMEQILIDQVEDTVRQLEHYSGRTIARIYIGKTFIPRRRAPGGGFVLFCCTNPNTWRMTGISSRWRSHHRQDYGRDGLVVLCAVTRDNVPNNSPMSQEQLALAMEQKLLHHYRLARPDERFVNETFTTGHLAQHNYHAYAVYMAFRYEDEAIGADTHPPRPPQPALTAVQYVNSPTQPSSVPTVIQPALSYKSSCSLPAIREQSQKRATKRKSSTSSPSISLSQPTKYTSTGTSPPSTKSTKLSCKPRGNLQPTKAQNGGPSKKAQQDSKQKSPKRSQSTSSYPPLKKPKLAISNLDTAPGPSNSSPSQPSRTIPTLSRPVANTQTSKHTPIANPTCTTNIRRAQIQPHDRPTTPEEADEDTLLGPDTPTDDDSPIYDTVQDSPHEMEVQNVPLPVPVNEMGEDTLLGGNFPQTDSPPDESLLDSPPSSPLSAGRDDQGPRQATLTASHSPHPTTNSDLSPVMILDDEHEPLTIVISDNEPHTSDSDSDSELELVTMPQKYRK